MYRSHFGSNLYYHNLQFSKEMNIDQLTDIASKNGTKSDNKKIFKLANIDMNTDNNSTLKSLSLEPFTDNKCIKTILSSERDAISKCLTKPFKLDDFTKSDDKNTIIILNNEYIQPISSEKEAVSKCLSIPFRLK
jgi:hypothetical protein